ncbi:helix-turn-helix domain-containing protein [Kosmotoga olearia]|uniref:DNA binding domain protein, excisionase family n=1 Tax=Kosmotoga olearia (strain ATCC BAA-1733 / DSM 21960 / TBF 19.5.1) TaxID=521045 RepID=C5CHT6_KOSOT|nr:helix-turn-helix domain-containing protein [Kosmotoga olearia]ACR78792.1 DNA binding domain protein, excisionase family [Kosmotoga olearia TBF 19.5.1]
MPDNQRLNQEYDILSKKEVAAYLRLDEHTAYRMARKGEIPAYKVAGQWRFKKMMIEEWLEQNLKYEKQGGQ